MARALSEGNAAACVSIQFAPYRSHHLQSLLTQLSIFPNTSSVVAHRDSMHDVALQVAKTVNERISKYAQVTLESCAYAGTGNVLKVQQLLAQAGEHIELKEDESWKVRHMVSYYAGSLSASLRSVQHLGQNQFFCHSCLKNSCLVF